MRVQKTHSLIEIEWPSFGEAKVPLRTPASELASRIDAARSAMEKSGLTHLVVYGDREHFANLAYLTGIDPRFEEIILVIGLHGDPLIVTGNECKGYLTFSPLYKEGRLRSECFQPFSLLNQPRGNSRLLKEIFAGEGIGNKSSIGCVGWKYFSDSEHPDGMHAIDLPSYIADTLRELSGKRNVVNSTAIFMNPDDGLRTFCSPSEIAYFEYTNVLASEGMKRMIFGMREGMTDHELAKLSGYNGESLGCHMTLATGSNSEIGLAGPTGELVRCGSPLSTNVCYWGSNCCRAGWVASSSKDLPAHAQDYVETFAGVYFEVMAKWFGMLKVGACGGDIATLIHNKLPFDKFGIFLNPGHLIHLDEWLSSPFYAGSEIRLHSGMAIQVDVIPSSPIYSSTRMEDGIVIADGSLRNRLKKEFPECYARCEKRRNFMDDVLGIQISEEVLPLSNIPAIVPPFFLNPNKIISMEK